MMSVCLSNVIYLFSGDWWSGLKLAVVCVFVAFLSKFGKYIYQSMRSWSTL